ncbi:HlyD family efflux transporter periplasmic adaptor subunit [Bacteroidales bacterium OttesenSCG-928-B11]|nr:HlyD family efflux transporter periplasmic adaptor subunit [Bacteroidales bacterium OttesenSCG-928-B11]
MNLKMKYLLLIFVGILFLGACNNKKDSADAYGVFEATEIIVSAENNGKMLVFNAEEGGIYQKGQELGIIDTFQFYLQIKQLESSIRAAMARRPDMPTQVSSLQEKLTALEKERIRTANLVGVNAIEAKRLDDVEAEITITKSQIEATKSNLNMQSQSILEEVEAMRFQKMQLEDALAKCRIKAPITGVVLKKYVEPNELVFHGKPLFKMANIEDMFIRVYVSEDMLSSLKYGQKTDVFIDAEEGQEKKLEGEIVWISPKAEFTPKMIQTKKERVNLVYAVKVMFKNDGSAKIGMPGDVVFK